MSISSQFIIKSFKWNRKAGKHMQELSSIMVDESFEENTKISKVKLSILKYKSTGTESVELDEELKKQVKEYENIMKNTDIDIENTADLMRILMNPINKHYNLLDSIGSIIRNSDLNNHMKVENIIDLLI